MPELLKLFLRNAAVGFALAVGFVTVLVALDVASLRTLATHSAAGWLGLGVLTYLLGLTFAAVQIAIAVMTLEER